MKFLLFLLVSLPVTLISTEILTPYTNKNTKHEYGGYSSYEDRHTSTEKFSVETFAEDRHSEKLDKVKRLLVLLRDLKDRHYRKKHMRLSDRVADTHMIQDTPYRPFTRVVIPHPPRPKGILLKRGPRKRRRRRRRRKKRRMRRKLGLRLNNRFNFKRIRKAYRERLFTRIFVCFFNLFC